MTEKGIPLHFNYWDPWWHEDPTIPTRSLQREWRTNTQQAGCGRLKGKGEEFFRYFIFYIGSNELLLLIRCVECFNVSLRINHKNFNLLRTKKREVLGPTMPFSPTDDCFSSWPLRQGGETCPGDHITVVTPSGEQTSNPRQSSIQRKSGYSEIREGYFLHGPHSTFSSSNPQLGSLSLRLPPSFQAPTKSWPKPYFYKTWKVADAFGYLFGFCQFHSQRQHCWAHSRGRWRWSAGFR